MKLKQNFLFLNRLIATAFAAGLWTTAALPAWAQFQVGDTFDTVTRDASKWGATDELQPEGSADWVQTGGKLEFRSDVTFFGNAYGVRTWSGQLPSFTQNWSTSVDVNLGAIVVDTEEGATLSLRVASGANDLDSFSLSFLAYRSFEGDFFRQVALQGDIEGGRLVNVFETASGENLKFAIRYDANSHMLIAEYGATASTMKTLGTIDTLLWGMQTATPFSISLQAQAYGLTFSATPGKLRFDNFSVQAEATRALATLQSGDDFNDNKRDTVKWGTLTANAGTGAFTESSSALIYSTTSTSASGFVDYATQFWNAGAGSLSNSWSARVEASLGAVTLANPNEEVQIGIMALNLDDPSDRVILGIGLGNTDSGPARNLIGSMRRDGSSNPDFDAIVPTTSTTVGLQIRWDATARKFFLEVDGNGATGGFTWNTLTNYSIDSEELSWELAPGARIQLALFGVSFEGLPVPNSGIAKLDNVVLTTDVPVIDPVNLTGITKVGNQIKLSWTGGKGPFQVQRREVIDQGVWTNVGTSTGTRDALVPLTGNLGFFRIQDLGQ